MLSWLVCRSGDGGDRLSLWLVVCFLASLENGLFAFGFFVQNMDGEFRGG
jgi:hypothetical protein